MATQQTTRPVDPWAAQRGARRAGAQRGGQEKRVTWIVLNPATGKVRSTQQPAGWKPPEGQMATQVRRRLTDKERRELVRDLNRTVKPIRQAAAWRGPGAGLMDRRARRALAAYSTYVERRTRPTVGQRLRGWAARKARNGAAYVGRVAKAWAYNRGQDAKALGRYLVHDIPAGIREMREERRVERERTAARAAAAVAPAPAAYDPWQDESWTPRWATTAPAADLEAPRGVRTVHVRATTTRDGVHRDAHVRRVGAR